MFATVDYTCHGSGLVHGCCCPFWRKSWITWVNLESFNSQRGRDTGCVWWVDIFSRMLSWYQHTDSCVTGLFSQCWQCSACGWEACHDCVVSISVSELSYACTSWFWPGFKQLPKAMCTHCSATLCHTTHFNHTEVNWAINHMWFLLQEAKQWASLLLSIWPPFWSNYRTSLLQQPIPNNHSVLIFENAKNKDKMHHLLSQGVPFIVNNIKMQGTFNSNYFVNKFYGHSCCIHYINVGKVDQITAELFFFFFWFMTTDMPKGYGCNHKQWANKGWIRAEALLRLWGCDDGVSNNSLLARQWGVPKEGSKGMKQYTNYSNYRSLINNRNNRYEGGKARILPSQRAKE